MESNKPKQVPISVGFVRLAPGAPARLSRGQGPPATPAAPSSPAPAPPVGESSPQPRRFVETWSLPPIFVARVLPPSPLGTLARSVEPGAERRIAIGSDHGGFRLKESLIELLHELRYEPEDCGTYSEASCDYPDFAQKVGETVRSGLCSLGIMIDGAGIGSAMALNKMVGIRAATVHSEATATNSREHNDANVLVLGSAQIHPGHARRITRIWLATEHAGGRHAKRVAKIMALERT